MLSTFGLLSQAMDKQLSSRLLVSTVFLCAASFLCHDPDGSTQAAVKIKPVTLQARVSKATGHDAA